MPRDTMNNTRGNRMALSMDELRILEEQILPTARRWLAYPMLDNHAMQTLDYWGETYEIPMYLRPAEERQRAGL